MLQKTALFALLGLALGATSVGACAFYDASGSTSGSSSGGGSATGSGVGGDASVIVNPDGERPPGPITYAALCGDGDCDPTYDGCVAPAGDGGAGEGGAGEGGAGAGAGGAQAGGGGAGTAQVTCHVGVVDGKTAPTCSPAGAGRVLGPCQSDLDCGPGLGCVASANTAPVTGVCQHYCCGDLEACPADTYCAPQPLFADGTLSVPVCTQVAPCMLLTEGACPEGQTCTVVRADGTTSCVPVGEGGQCSACPCGPGFVCSNATGTCQKLCHTDGVGECGGESGTCQGGSNLPSGVGVCIGGDADCSK
jgi:hypothetical protein